MVSYADIEEASRRIGGYAVRTPVLTSRQADEDANANLFFKAELFQRTGAFKFRGAFNALAMRAEQGNLTGVLTFSSGNHGQALSRAGQILGIPVTVVMPEDAPQIKIAATRGYGAEIILFDRNELTREALGAELSAERGLDIIHPYDHPDIIAGQGTMAREFLAEVPDLDVLLVCLGGGGLLSGSALTMRALRPQAQVIGVEPELADDAYRSFKSGTLQTVENPDTIADGARTPSLGKLTWPLVRENVNEIVTVSDEAILATTKWIWERMKVAVEPTGALAYAAVRSGKVDVKGQRVGIVLTGGNVDVAALASLFQLD
ncbi:MAG: threo-3-hydroxy-L-aspartate ammonia-lyase [Fimbriimonadaceae bacterium]|nr:threo-3-hydroxy-L-aspartate ammonia-lyase [Fimbriimonadaceae bacterium]